MFLPSLSRYRIGCTGWSYQDWRGTFYRSHYPPDEELQRYARVFSLVEVDSTYYRTPTRQQTKWWARVTPDPFLFTFMLPGDFTQRSGASGIRPDLDAFLEALQPLRQAHKLGPLVAQLPPSFRREKDAGALRSLVDRWPRGLRLAVELRHPSWWKDAMYDLLRASNAALAWSLHEENATPPVVTADWLYVRAIGDRTITRFHGIQKDGPTNCAPSSSLSSKKAPWPRPSWSSSTTTSWAMPPPRPASWLTCSANLRRTWRPLGENPGGRHGTVPARLSSIKSGRPHAPRVPPWPRVPIARRRSLPADRRRSTATPAGVRCPCGALQVRQHPSHPPHRLGRPFPRRHRGRLSR